ncbi:hypothetical protein [Vibrio mediterranei]|uniref:hypothetical protein n=1 Tax=Vibrio mediterranei TaxID=689 RepID=UPI0040678730
MKKILKSLALLQGRAKTAAKPKAATRKMDVNKVFNDLSDFDFDSADGLYYVPWIRSHGDRVFQTINARTDLEIKAIPIFKDIESATQRHFISRMLRDDTDTYRRYLRKMLMPYAGVIQGLCVSMDWNLSMRVLVSVARELHIPVTLIPHEAVFACRDRYYKDIKFGADHPIADRILVWGQLQKNIFMERGYPEERIFVTGAPKFDTHHDYIPEFTRDMFCRLHGLNTNLPIFLFSAQPLDSQFNKAIAQQSQNDAISDLLDFCIEKNVQLIVRMPPSDEQILSGPLLSKLNSTPLAAIDQASLYMSSPEEAIYHSELVASVNSTMLFEAVLMDTEAVSTKYVEFDEIWHNAGIPSASNAEDLHALCEKVVANEFVVDASGMAWASENFSAGEFDGLASHRIADLLRYKPELFTDHERMLSKGFGAIGYVEVDNKELAERCAKALGLRKAVRVKNEAMVAGVDCLLEGQSATFHRLAKSTRVNVVNVLEQTSNELRLECKAYGEELPVVLLSFDGENAQVHRVGEKLVFIDEAHLFLSNDKATRALSKARIEQVESQLQRTEMGAS